MPQHPDLSDRLYDETDREIREADAAAAEDAWLLEFELRRLRASDPSYEDYLAERDLETRAPMCIGDDRYDPDERGHAGIDGRLFAVTGEDDEGRVWRKREVA